MQIVPLQAVPRQSIKTVLGGQIVQLDVYQLRYGMFMNVTVNGELETGAVICNNLSRIIRDAYLNQGAGFSGDFVFDDTHGSSNPVYTGLGSQYQLLYLSQDDLTVLGFAA